MKLSPAPPNYGVRFRRLDVEGCPAISAKYHSVSDTSLATTIGFNGTAISTVEHLMAALLGTGVDNVLVEVDGPEVPIFDGSAVPYFRLLQRSGLKKQNACRQFIKIEKPFILEEGDAYLRVQPADYFQICYTIDFPHPMIGKQRYSWCFNRNTFARDVAKARTFGFLKDVETLQSMGLVQGGSLANAIVFDESNLLNSDGFRYPDECVRHKVLDFIGDLALAGKPLLGYFEAYKAGHKLHNRFVEELLTRKGYCSLLPSAPECRSFFPATPLPSFMDGLSFTAKPL